MLRSNRVLFIIYLFLFLNGCKEKQKEQLLFKKLTTNKEIVMVTSMGNLQFKLYSETPHHTDNFYTLVKKGFYLNSLLHLIIPEYTIQGGEFQSHKNKIRKEELDNPDSWIENEFNSQLIHKKGALSALRLANESNPEKKSNPHQFFIVAGKKQSELSLKMVENKINQQIFYEGFIKKYPFHTYDSASSAQIIQYKTDYDNNYRREYTKFKEQFIYTKEQRETYKKKGGLPQLDMNYTVFGELIEGWEVLDKLAEVMTDKNYVPTEEIVIQIFVVE